MVWLGGCPWELSPVLASVLDSLFPNRSLLSLVCGLFMHKGMTPP